MRKSKSKPAFSFRPLTNYVAVILDPVERVTPGGIELPEASIKPSREGEVVAVGPGYFKPGGLFVPTNAKVGDRVTVSGKAQTEMEHEGLSFVLMREPEIMLVHSSVSA